MPLIEKRTAKAYIRTSDRARQYFISVAEKNKASVNDVFEIFFERFLDYNEQDPLGPEYVIGTPFRSNKELVYLRMKPSLKKKFVKLSKHLKIGMGDLLQYLTNNYRFLLSK